jgi:hypothetical protein
MSNISLKKGFVYRNRIREKVMITEVISRDIDGVAVSFQDDRGFNYRQNGLVEEFPSEYDLVEELFECHGRDTADQINFYENDYYVFSSFSSFSLKWKGVRFDTLEAAYHYEKFDAYGYRDQVDTNFKELAIIRGMIRRANSAHEAFQIAQGHKDKRRPDWDDKEAKVRTMFMLIIEKVKQHEYVKTKLLKTYGRQLSEDSWRDGYWGSHNGGLDVLGQLWMLVRDITESGQLDEIDPLTYSLDSIKTAHLLTTEIDFTETSEIWIKAPLPEGIVDIPGNRQKLKDIVTCVDVGHIRIGEL